MQSVLNLERYPLDKPNSPEYRALLAECQSALDENGMFNLHGFMKAEIAGATADELKPLMESDSFTHSRRHNIYFKKVFDDLPEDHPALVESETTNHTLCGDQLVNSLITQVYQWQPLVDFLAKVMGKAQLFTMEDQLARVNVMGYDQGETLNWHFDRSEFTTTLLLQAPEAGGVFQYHTDLRTADNPNYEGVARLLRGDNPELQQLTLSPGTLNVFRGKNTPHRVTAVSGEVARMVAVFSYFERPGVVFSEEEQLGFYGRRSI